MSLVKIPSALKIENPNPLRYFEMCITNRTEAQMLSSFLSFYLRFLRLRIQLQLEIIFLRKQIEILTRTSRKPRLLYVLVFLSHDRRKIIHFNVTDHPTSEWTTQQLRNAFYDQAIPKFLIRDGDTKFGEVFTQVVSGLGMEPLLTAYRSPWQKWILRKTHREHPEGMS